MTFKELRISPTNQTPEIILGSGSLIIKGRSMKIIDPASFNRIEEWINKYLSDPPDVTTVNVYLEYLNTGNLFFYNHLLKKLVSFDSEKNTLIVNWHHEEGDEDIIEKGEYISSILGIPFNFILISDNTDL